MTRRPRAGGALAGTVAASAAVWIVSALAGWTGCAQVAPPPGGPRDTVPPLLIAVQPDSLSVRPGFEDEVRFEFDESISERDFRGAVNVYPYEGRPDADKGARDIRVRPRAGWSDGRIYHIVIETRVQDLFGNRLDRSIRYVLSTGPEIPANQVAGRVYDRITGRPLREGRVDLVRSPDTLRYGAATDSAGAFRLGRLPPGDYTVIGYEDRNRNGRADEFDRTDSARVALGPADTLGLELRVFEHDTVPPQLVGARSVDSMTVELEFDRYLDPEVRVPASAVTITDSAGVDSVAVDSVLNANVYAGRRDRLGRPVAPPDTAPPDTAAPLPSQRLIVVARSAIPAGAYVVEVERVVSLSGVPGSGTATWTQPEPPRPAVPADTLPADTLPADTVPRDTVPSDRLPADTVPPDTVPGDALPSGGASLDAGPGDALPTGALPPGRARGMARDPVTDVIWREPAILGRNG